ncbi:ABC transporter permease [soil metagenome]
MKTLRMGKGLSLAPETGSGLALPASASAAATDAAARLDGVEPVPPSPQPPQTSKPALELLVQHASELESTARSIEPAIVTAPLVVLESALKAFTGKLLKWLPSLCYTVLSLAMLVGLWHLATKYRIDWYIRFNNIPTPFEVITELNKLARENTFYTNMWLSLRRIVFGFGIATILGVGLGLVIGRFTLLSRLVFPAFEVLRPIPAIAWVPMSIMLWPTNETSIVFITFLGSFFPILLNTIHGVHAVDPVLVRAARSLGASEFNVLRLVILNSALPYIFTGLAVGMGVAWVSLIAAEMISGQFGIGYFTWEAYSLVQYSHIVIGMALIGVLGLLCSGAIRLVGHLMMPWVKPQAGGAH